MLMISSTTFDRIIIDSIPYVIHFYSYPLSIIGSMQTIIGSLWLVGQLFTIPGIQDSRLEDSRFGAWDKTRQDPRPVTSLVLLCILYQAVLVMSMVSPFLYICVRDQDSRQDLRHVPAVLLHLSGSGYVSQVI